MVVFEDGKPRTGEYRRFRIRTVEGPNDFASHQEVLRRRFRRVSPGDEGTAEERRWAMPDLVIIDGGKGQVERREGGPRRARAARPAARRPRQGARGAVPARPRRPGPAADDVTGAVPRPAAPRRGPPVRDHVPPRPARQGDGPLGVRRPARASARSAAARCCGSSARSSASARRRSSRSRPCPGIGRALAERIKAHAGGLRAGVRGRRSPGGLPASRRGLRQVRRASVYHPPRCAEPAPS